MKPEDLDDALVDDEVDDEQVDVDRFKVARDGDHLVTPFQCDACHFYNIQKRGPLVNSTEDKLLLLCIRRANLDSFWARERSTVAGNRREGVRFVNTCRLLGVENPYPPRGPFPLEDNFGMLVACVILIRSLDEGKNATNVQFETIRKLRSHFSNFYHTTPGGVGVTFIGTEGPNLTVSYSPTSSLWFNRFMRGCHKRMGDVWLPDRPVTIQELLACLALLESDWVGTKEHEVQKRLYICLTGTLLTVGFLGAFRGEEIVRLDLGGLRKYWHEGVYNPSTPHVPVILSGRFKKETGIKFFCQPMPFQSKSGMGVKIWLERMLATYDRIEIKSGPVFRITTKGKSKRASSGDLDILFHAIVSRVQKSNPRLIPVSVNVEEEYSVYRSLRRGATAEAQNVGVPKSVIEANNRWRKRERARGLTPGMSMMERYSEAKASVPTLIRFAESL